jgi:mediator of RNA polymerase II transcription subunit 13
VDSIPGPLLELIHQQSTFATSQQNAIVKYSRQYLRNTTQPPSLSMVELMDGNDVIFVALNQVKTASDPATSPVTKLDEAQKGTCLHKWSLLPAAGPNCSEDVIRVMKSLKPILNMSLHIKKSAKPTSTNKGLSVDGPLTWRQFHQMAGPATKGNTDDQVEPLPVPTITVGHERDFLSLSPLSLHFWESLSLEPYSQPRDVVYFVVAPDNEVLLNNAKTFFKNLSQEYEVRIDMDLHSRKISTKPSFNLYFIFSCLVC